MGREEIEVVGSSSKEAKEEFSPIGIRVLVVDDDVVCLKVIEGLLLKCGYKVTTSQHALVALQLLRDNMGNFDLVMSDVNMPDMDGFELLKIVVSMNLPVIMLSVDDDVNTVKKGIEYGASDYILKPPRLEVIQLIWKHVVKKSLQDTKVTANDTINKSETLSKSDEDNTSKRKCKDQIKENDGDAEEYTDEDIPTQKRPRIAWTVDRHENFKAAVNKLGLDRAVPKKILDLMGDPQLTRENVASHLQKYRKTLKKSSNEVIQQYDSLRAGSSRASASSVVFPFSNQGPNPCSVHGFSIEGYQNHQRSIPFAPRTSTWMPLPLNHQSNLRQNVLLTNQASALRPHSVGCTSNPFIIEAGTQSASGHASYQPIVPIVNQPNGYIKNNASQINWPRETISSPSLISQPGYLPNQQGIESVFAHDNLQKFVLEDTIAAEFDGMPPMQNGQHQPNPFSSGNAEDLGMGNQINGDSMDQESMGQKQSDEISSSDMLVPFLDPNHEEANFHLSHCQSAEDLHTAIKQFQESKEMTGGDDL